MVPPRAQGAASRTAPAHSWNPRAIALFALILSALTTVALVGTFHHRPTPAGLPDDPAVAAARAALGPRLPVASGELRFTSSMDGIDEALAAPAAPDSTLVSGLAAAERWLHEARARHPRDPRLPVALGHLELAAQRLERAERHYRSALARAPRYGEARLGLGVALAMRAETQGDARAARRLRLEAIAQLAAVEAGDRFHLPALYDRALLLARVGRAAEARQWAGRYAELDPASPWAATLKRAVGAPAGVN